MLKAKNKFFIVWSLSHIMRSKILGFVLTQCIYNRNFNFYLKYASSKSFATCIEYLPFAPCSITTAIATSGFSYGA